MKIAVVFGGKSSEHNVSILTGTMVISAIKDADEVIPVYIKSDGSFYTGKTLTKAYAYKDDKLFRPKPCHFVPNDHFLHVGRGRIFIDAVVLCCHGLNGEDGSIQGLIELSGIPYTGSGITASAVSLDKLCMKNLFKAHKIPAVKFIGLDKYGYAGDFYGTLDKVKKKLGYPVIVKPNRLGSSIGISVAKDAGELAEALEEAFKYDVDVVIEKALEDFTEVNCAVIGNGKELIVSDIEKPLFKSKFLSYNDKYGLKSASVKMSENSKNKGTSREFPAALSVETADKVKRLAAETFRALGCRGVARVDFLLDGDNVYVNELNAIPGSLSYYLFEPQGITFEKLIHKLIVIAKEERAEFDQLMFEGY